MIYMTKNDDISDEDKALFRESMRQVKPLANKTKRHTYHPTVSIDNKQRASFAIRRSEIPQEPSASNYYLSSYYQEEVQTNTTLSYCRHGIPKKRFLEIKNGQFQIQATLDLHGLKPEDACDSLCKFIEQASISNHRYLLIIHGKGGRHGEAPILKNRVNHWLPQLPQILAFHSALPKHGGTGAVYVLLSRQRSAPEFQ